jgi:hypothetical protein
VCVCLSLPANPKSPAAISSVSNLGLLILTRKNHVGLE